MNLASRKILDKSFTWLSLCAVAAMCLAVVVFLAPILVRGANAVVFEATVEHSRFLYEVLGRGGGVAYERMCERAEKARAPLYAMVSECENPSSGRFAETSERIGRARASALASMEADLPKIMEALGSEGRLAALSGIAASAWSGYAAAVADAAEASGKDGTGVALEKFLQEQRDSISADIRRAVNSLSKKAKLGVVEKSLVRRAFAEAAEAGLADVSDRLSAKNRAFTVLMEGVRELLGPEDAAGRAQARLMRNRFGQTRMDVARKILDEDILKISTYESDAAGNQISVRIDSREYFAGTPAEKIIDYVEENMDAMLQPHLTFYWGFFFDDPYDSNIFGGIWPMILGTFYLTAGAMLIAAPIGAVSAIYLVEYAGGGRIVSVLRMCISTLAGVPSIVFGLFGLAFLINTLKLSDGKSVLAGCITLALLILPTIIRSCEEAVRAVPATYREASLGLGAGKWKMITGVVVPAALPGMLTGVIISMGRAAGETAPIIFTAATSTGAAIGLSKIFSQPTPALPWNIYNICAEHEMADRVMHVQYGMVLTLLAIVLSLNFVAIVLRARLSKKLKR